jgi:hypothetical protein
MREGGEFTYAPIQPLVLASSELDEMTRRERRFALDLDAEGIPSPGSAARDGLMPLPYHARKHRWPEHRNSERSRVPDRSRTRRARME